MASIAPPKTFQMPITRGQLVPLAFTCLWFTLIVYAIMITPPSTWNKYGEQVTAWVSPEQARVRVAATAALVLAALGGLSRWNAVFGAIRQQPYVYLALGVVFVIMTLGAVARGSPREISYVTFFAAHIMAAGLIFTSAPKIQAAFLSYIGYSTTIACSIYFAIVGWPVNRWFGEIHPNIASFLFVTIFIIFFPRRNRFGILVSLAAFGFSMLLSSRYAMTIMILVAGFEISSKLKKNDATMILFVVLPLALLLLTMALQSELATIFEIDSNKRGLGSGLGGRADLNSRSFADLGNHIFFGAGFRNTAGYVFGHNGYLNLLQEVGMFTFAVLMFCIVAAIMSALRLIFGRRRRYVDLVMSYFFMSGIFAAISQPQLLNFGDIQGITFVLGFAYLLVLKRVPRPVTELSDLSHLSNRARPWRPDPIPGAIPGSA